MPWLCASSPPGSDAVQTTADPVPAGGRLGGGEACATPRASGVAGGWCGRLLPRARGRGGARHRPQRCRLPLLRGNEATVDGMIKAHHAPANLPRSIGRECEEVVSAGNRCRSVATRTPSPASPPPPQQREPPTPTLRLKLCRSTSCTFCPNRTGRARWAWSSSPSSWWAPTRPSSR